VVALLKTNVHCTASGDRNGSRFGLLGRGVPRDLAMQVKPDERNAVSGAVVPAAT
jgi:hypothetical protein